MPAPAHQDSGSTQVVQPIVEKPPCDSAEGTTEPAGAPSDDDGCKRPSDGNPAVFMILGAISFTFMAGMANALGSRCDWRLVAQSRTVFSFLAALTLAKLGGATLVFARPRILWMRSFAGTFSLMTTFYALANLPIADVLTLTNTYPIWIVLIGFLVWGEVVEPSLLLAIFSAVFGVILIQQPHLDGNMLAIASALSAAVFTSVAMIGLNRLGSIDPRAVVTHFSGVAALIMIPVISFGHPVDWSDLRDPITVALLAGVGITGTIGQILLTKAYAIGSAPRIAVIGMSQVAMGLVFDIAFRQQLPPRLSLIGMAFVVCPVLWIISRGKGRPRPATIGKKENPQAADSTISPKPPIDAPGKILREQIPSASASAQS